MALKEKALRRLTEKLNAAGISWALTGDYMLCQMGLTENWHSFDLAVAPDAMPAADRVLTRLGMRHEEDGGRIGYHFDGADILLGSWADFTPDALGTPVTVLGTSVPVLCPEDALVWMLENGRSAAAEQIAAMLREKGSAKPERLHGRGVQPQIDALMEG